MHKELNIYVCGVRVREQLLVINGQNNIEMITTDADRYLMLESGVMGDYDRYADMLDTFARDNGMGANRNEIFAAYDASENFRNPKIKMYCPVK